VCALHCAAQSVCFALHIHTYSVQRRGYEVTYFGYDQNIVWLELALFRRITLKGTMNLSCLLCVSQ
jgi:hypothetical protein